MSIKEEFYKILSFFMIISTIFISVTSIAVVRKIVINDMRDKGDSIARILSTVAKDSMLVHDYVTMERYVREIVNDSNIRSLIVTRSDGEIIAKAVSEETKEKGYNLRYPITIGKSALGTIDINFSTKRVNSISKKIIITAVVFIVIVHGIAFFVNNVIISRLIVLPLRSFAQAVKSLRDGMMCLFLSIWPVNIIYQGQLFLFIKASDSYFIKATSFSYFTISGTFICCFFLMLSPFSSIL